MLNQRKSAARTRPVIPYRVSDIEAAPHSWQTDFGWPVSTAKLIEVSTGVMRRYVDLIVDADHAERSILLLGRPFNRAAAIVEAAISIAAEGEAGLELSGPTDLEILRGTNSIHTTDTELMRLPAPSLHNAWLRRIARMKTWTSWSQLPRALLHPNMIAVSHNALLRSEAAQSSSALGFEHADILFQRCINEGDREHHGLIKPHALEELIERTAMTLADEQALHPQMRDRTAMLLRNLCAQDFGRANATLGALTRARSIPLQLWSGSAGPYKVRALGIETLRRGGAAVRFDHGGTVPLMANGDFIAQQELAVSSTFVTPTSRAAEVTSIAAGQARLRSEPTAVVRGGRGDPALDPGRASPVGAQGPRRRVLYASTCYYPFSQTFPPLPPSAVYLDWQRRLILALSRLPIDLIHKPHPGGVYKGCAPSLINLARVSVRPFEEEITNTDVVVFDWAASTTFSVALSSDKIIVLLDFGSMPFDPTIRDEIGIRCRVLPVSSDQRNRLVVDELALSEAICAGEARAEPGPFREFFLGQYA